MIVYLILYVVVVCESASASTSVSECACTRAVPAANGPGIGSV